MFWTVIAWITAILLWSAIITWTFVIALWTVQIFTHLIRRFYAFFK